MGDYSPVREDKQPGQGITVYDRYDWALASYRRYETWDLHAVVIDYMSKRSKCLWGCSGHKLYLKGATPNEGALY